MKAAVNMVSKQDMWNFGGHCSFPDLINQSDWSMDMIFSLYEGVWPARLERDKFCRIFETES